MLHTPVRNLHARESTRTAYQHTVSKYSTKRRRWINKYLISPPAAKPFLPSDEAVTALVRTVPDIVSHTVSRTATHDLLTIYVPDKSVFSMRASSAQIRLRDSFLRDIARAALPFRELSERLVSDCSDFLANEGFVWMNWNGRWVTAYTPECKRYEGRLVTGGPHERGFRRIERACRNVGSFEYGIAPWR